MKRIIIFLTIIISAILLTSCSHTEASSADNEIISQVKTVIMQSDFIELLYIGRYYMPTDGNDVSQNGRTYKSFNITYSDIPDMFLETSNIYFKEIEEISPNYYISEIPFDNLADMKKEVETVLTYNCAEKLLYNLYDNDYLEYNNKLLRAFDRDTITAYTADYETVTIIEHSEDKLTAIVKTYHHLDNSELQVIYKLVLEDGLWKIDDIIHGN